MSDSTLYDDDILLWSEQQAAAIRRLRETTRGLPNELDIENVAEEIESVGRSELATVESYIELILVHLIKLVVEPEAESVRHWREEVGGFHSGLRRRYAPSMRRRVDIDEIWNDAREQLRLGSGGAEPEVVGRLADKCPVVLDDLLGKRIDLDGLVGRVRGALLSPGTGQ
jgi:hypothetical protein